MEEKEREHIVDVVIDIVATCDRLAEKKTELLKQKQELNEKIEKLDAEFDAEMKKAYNISKDVEFLGSFADLVAMAKFQEAIEEVKEEARREFSQ